MARTQKAKCDGCGGEVVEKVANEEWFDVKATLNFRDSSETIKGEFCSAHCCLRSLNSSINALIQGTSPKG